MKLNDSTKIFIYIILIAIYHYFIQNDLEKLFFKCHFDYDSITPFFISNAYKTTLNIT